NSTAVLELLVALERDRKRLPESIDLARRLVDAEPTNGRYYFTLGALQGEAGQREPSIASVRKAIDLNPKNAAALNYLGYSLAEEGQSLDEAEQLILRALAVEPNDGFYADSLGWVYYQRGDYDRAVEQLERAVELAGEDATVSEHLADAYEKVGRDPEAQRLYGEALRRAETPEQRSRIELKMRDAARAAKPGEQSL